MASWRTTPDNPGLRVYADSRGDFWVKSPDADYTCRCGATGYAKGEDDVKVLIGEYMAVHHPHMQDGAA